MSDISVKYIDHMGNDLRVVQSARISFAGSSEVLTARDEALIAYLAQHQHMTPFEHCCLSVLVECPIYISKQIMRHRTFAYNEVSRRYTSKNLEVYTPPILREQATTNRQASDGPHPLSEHWRHKIQLLQDNSLALYEQMIKDGVCREQARGVLPQNTMTSLYMTGNLRNWAHFIKLRREEGAQFEVQLVAARVEDLLNEHFPISARSLL